jgi:predicted RecB family nuclease
MFLLDSAEPDAAGDLIISASDVVSASECTYGLLRKLDEILQRSPKLEVRRDGMLQLTADLGTRHEERMLGEFEAKYGEAGVCSFTDAGVYGDRAKLVRAHAETLAALRSGYDVVYQGTFFDGVFTGRADFLVRRPDGAIAVYDTKLSRHARTTALVQLAAYADQLEANGIPVFSEGRLILGDATVTRHRMPELLPVFREKRDRLLKILHAHRSGGSVVDWQDDGISRCFTCPYCAEQAAAENDLRLVHNMSSARRKALRGKGIRTVAELAEMPVEGIEDKVLERLHGQASLQAGTDTGDGSINGVSYRVLEGHTLTELPEPSAGDIFFDFEGDPLWTESGRGAWGLEYLFGWVTQDGAGEPEFGYLWANDRAAERTALVRFMEKVAARREKYPDMHIYHYAAYEQSALKRLAQRHGLMEEELDVLLREHVFVDLYQTVSNSLRVSAPSYSIKKLEPLYMGGYLRKGLDNAADSVTFYSEYCALADLGKTAEAAARRQDILDYNTDDCVSTLRLRDWLLELGERFSARGRPVPNSEDDRDAMTVPDSVPAGITAWLEAARAAGDLDEDAVAVAMIAAGVDFHRREKKAGAWEHFRRLAAPVAEWKDSRGVFTVDRASVDEDWSTTPKGKLERHVQLTGTLAAGTGKVLGEKVNELYEAPFPTWAFLPKGISRAVRRGTTEITDVQSSGSGTVIRIREVLHADDAPFYELPMAFVVEDNINNDSLSRSLLALARNTEAMLPKLPAHPGVEILRRRTPRLKTLAALPPAGEDFIGPITGALLDLDCSYLAVQGPPGTGKTYNGSRVIARLALEHGWKIGVVAQSHAAVEGVLEEVLAAGVPAASIGKARKTGSEKVFPWRELKTPKLHREMVDAAGGAVIGGTVWKFADPKNFGPHELDLIVVEEAGQFSLANTLVAAGAARRILLLGDPQQLPQVTQGTHPEPVDTSALGWLSSGDAVLPAELGYFLNVSRRMHKALCEPVSTLAYDGKLHSAPEADAREISGVQAGLETITVEHAGNSVESLEEAAEVLHQVRFHLGLDWKDGTGARKLVQNDLLVVAPYNAQVQLIHSTLAAAGLEQVRVGTVDNFQGREAPVVIVSMTVSSPADVPRGMDFVLQRNRVNVAVSRGQYRAVLIRSAELTNYMPARPQQLEELGAFITLCGG